MTDVYNQLGNDYRGNLSASVTNSKKCVVSDKMMTLKVKKVATMIEYWCKGDPTIGLVIPIFTLSSAKKKN